MNESKTNISSVHPFHRMLKLSLSLSLTPYPCRHCHHLFILRCMHFLSSYLHSQFSFQEKTKEKHSMTCESKTKCFHFLLPSVHSVSVSVSVPFSFSFSVDVDFYVLPFTAPCTNKIKPANQQNHTHII